MIDKQSGVAPVDALASSNGTTELMTKVSPRSIAETVARLQSLAEGKGMKVFAVIDHSGEAKNMPTNACQHFYRCTGCGELVTPKPGECCGYCSYADAVCPPKQEVQDAPA